MSDTDAQVQKYDTMLVTVGMFIGVATASIMAVLAAMNFPSADWVAATMGGTTGGFALAAVGATYWYSAENATEEAETA